MEIKYKIMYKPFEYKKRWLCWNRNIYLKNKGIEKFNFFNAKNKVKSLNKLYKDKFKIKEI